MNNNFDNLTFINKFNSENDFLEFRQGGIGGSDVAAIMNESPFKTAEDVWNSKKNDDNNYIKPLSKRQKDRMEQGKFFEPHIIKHFSDKNNLKPTKVSFAFFDKNFIHRRRSSCTFRWMKRRKARFRGWPRHGAASPQSLSAGRGACARARPRFS
jgi:hypothetical protein